jgi:hypothetical protein
VGGVNEHERPTESQDEEREFTQRVFVAMMLAPTIEICEALLRGERVPVDCLDPEWVQRFGWRQG